MSANFYEPQMWCPGLRTDHPLSRSLVGYWPVWAGSGDRVMNVANQTLFGTAAGGPAWGAGPRGPLLGFGGDPDIVSGPFPAATNPITIACLFTTGASGTSRPFNVGSDSESDEYWSLDADIGNDWTFFSRSGSTQRVIVGGSPTANTVYFMVGTVSSSNFGILYLDGVRFGGNGVANPIGTNGFAIGALKRDPIIFSTCKVHLCAFWSRVLSAPEVQQFTFKPYDLITLRRRTYFYATGGGAPPAGNRRRRLLLAG